MQEKDPKMKLDDLYWGILEDIHIAGESLFMEETISRHASSINDKGFGNLFGILQRILLDNARLYIRRIFEKQKGFSLRSIPAILEHMSENKDCLKITDRAHLEKKLVELEADSQGLEDLKDKKAGDSEITNFCVSFFLSKLESLDQDGPLEKIKEVTDKKIAHNEDIEVKELKTHTYEEMDKLLDFAKNFLSVVAGGFLNATPIHDNKRCGNALKRMLIKAEVIENDMPTSS